MGGIPEGRSVAGPVADDGAAGETPAPSGVAAVVVEVAETLLELGFEELYSESALARGITPIVCVRPVCIPLTSKFRRQPPRFGFHREPAIVGKTRASTGTSYSVASSAREQNVMRWVLMSLVAVSAG